MSSPAFRNPTSLGVPALRVGVVGATGAVGREMLSILEERAWPLREVRALASARSAGSSTPFAGGTLEILETSAEALADLDVVLLAVEADAARTLAPAAARAGALVVDNSSAFRLDPAVALVVPEVNGRALQPVREARSADPRHGAIIANPNCTAAILTMAVEPLRRAFGIRSLVVSTYQAASGAGLKGMEELLEQTAGHLAGAAPPPRHFREPFGFNLFSHDSAVDPHTGFNGEESKVIAETRRILALPALEVMITCVRVPVVRAHAESVVVELESAASAEAVRGALASFAGVRVVDDRGANDFPTPLKAAGRDEVLVGRVRVLDVPGGVGRRVGLFIAGDQLRKGAALNAVQIAECVLGMGGM